MLMLMLMPMLMLIPYSYYSPTNHDDPRPE